MSARSAVHIAPMPECDDDHQQDTIVDRVDDAVVADAHAEAVASLERLGTRWARIVTEERDRTADTGPVLMVDPLQRSSGGGTEFDAVAHCQPRSAFTSSQGTFGPSSAMALSKAATSAASSRASIIRS